MEEKAKAHGGSSGDHTGSSNLDCFTAEGHNIPDIEDLAIQPVSQPSTYPATTGSFPPQYFPDFTEDFLSPEYETPPSAFAVHQFGSDPSRETPGSADLSAQSTSLVNQSLENITLDGAGMEESIDLGISEGIRDLNDEGDEISLNHLTLDLMGSSDQLADVSNEADAEIRPAADMLDFSAEARQALGEDVPQDFREIAVETTSEDDIKIEGTEQDETLLNESSSDEHRRKSETEVECTSGAVKPSDALHSLKIVAEDAVEVGFVVEESPKDDFTHSGDDQTKSTLASVASSRSLIKFFAASDAGGTDIEGKNFFDSFSTGNEPQEIIPSPNTSSLGSPHKELFIPSSSDFPDKVPDKAFAVSDSSTVASHHTPQPAFQFHEPQLGFNWQVTPSPIVMSASGSSGEGLGHVAADDEESNRHHDAWIPSEVTGRVLALALSGTGSAPLSPAQLCRPFIVMTDMLGDPVYDLLLRSMGEQEANKRLILNADSVPQDDVGLRQLIKSDCLRSAVDLSCRLLTNQCGQGQGQSKAGRHTPYSLQLWFTRLSLMVKLRLLTQAEAEMEAFSNFDTPDLYFEYHQDIFPLRRGSMVPFGMRLLHAELPQLCGHAQESLDRLYYIQTVISKMLTNLRTGLSEDGSMTLNDKSRSASEELWRQRRVRVMYSIGNCLLNVKDYGSAVEVYKCLLNEDEPNKYHLYNGLGRIFLQMGDVISASKHFEMSDQLDTTESAKCQRLINRGLVALGNNSFNEAHELFKEAVDIDNNNILAVNNMAVCLLYLGRLGRALQSLETLVYTDPQRNIQETTILNLCTLYELESSEALRKKQKLLSLIGQHRGNGFNVACLKMS